MFQILYFILCLAWLLQSETHIHQNTNVNILLTNVNI